MPTAQLIFCQIRQSVALNISTLYNATNLQNVTEQDLSKIPEDQIF